ncbi:MAG: hypothetical protein RL885_04625 [Planctomycetota bacterium]
MILPTCLMLLATAPLPLQTHDDIERWVADLRSIDEEVQDSAIWELESLRPRVLRPYRQALFETYRRSYESETEYSSWIPASILTCLPESETGWLLERAASLDDEAREDLLDSWITDIHKPLAPPLDQAAQAALSSALRSVSSSKRMMAAELIRAAGQRFQGDLEALTGAMADPDPTLRALCAEILGDRRAGGELVGERQLEAALDDPDPAVVEAAALALAKRPGPLSQRHESILVEMGRSGSAEALLLLGRVSASSQVRQEMLDLCRAGQLSLRGVAIESLWNAEGRPEPLPFDLNEMLIDLVCSPDEQTRATGVQTAKRLGAAALPALRLGLESPELSVGYSCAMVLSGCGASVEESARALVPFLPHVSTWCSRPPRAVSVLCELGPGVLPFLKPLLARIDEEPIDRNVLSVISGVEIDPTAVALLEEVIRTSGRASVRETAAEILQRSEPTPRPTALFLLDSLENTEDDWETVELLDALSSQEHQASEQIAETMEWLLQRVSAQSLSEASRIQAGLALSILQVAGHSESASFARHLVFLQTLPSEVRSRALECWIALEPDPNSADLLTMIADVVAGDSAELSEGDWIQAVLRGLTVRPDFPLNPSLASSLVNRKPFSQASLDFMASRPSLGQELLLELLKTLPASERLEVDDWWWMPSDSSLAEAIRTIRPPVQSILPVLLDRLWVDGDPAQGEPALLPDKNVLACLVGFRSEIEGLPVEIRERCRNEAWSLIDLIEVSPKEQVFFFEDDEPWGWGNAEVLAAAALGNEVVEGRLLDLLAQNLSLVPVLLEAGVRREIVANRVLAVLRDGVRVLDSCELEKALIPLGTEVRDAAPCVSALIANEDLDIWTGLGILDTILEGTRERPELLDRIRRAPSEVVPLEDQIRLQITEDCIAGVPIRVPLEVQRLDSSTQNALIEVIDKLRIRQRQGSSGIGSVR